MSFPVAKAQERYDKLVRQQDLVPAIELASFVRKTKGDDQ